MWSFSGSNVMFNNGKYKNTCIMHAAKDIMPVGFSQIRWAYWQERHEVILRVWKFWSSLAPSPSCLHTLPESDAVRTPKEIKFPLTPYKSHISLRKTVCNEFHTTAVSKSSQPFAPCLVHTSSFEASRNKAEYIKFCGSGSSSFAVSGWHHNLPAQTPSAGRARGRSSRVCATCIFNPVMTVLQE